MEEGGLMKNLRTISQKLNKFHKFDKFKVRRLSSPSEIASRMRDYFIRGKQLVNANFVLESCG